MFAIAQALAQQPPAGTATISGRVVDGFTGEPMQGLTVRASAGTPPGITAVTDRDGGFRVEQVPVPGASINVFRTGFSGGLPGQRSARDLPVGLDLEPGEARAGVVLRLWKNGAITGRVDDDAGDPVVGAYVEALAERDTEGPARFVAASSGITDDRGVYRLSNVPPGRYAVALPVARQPARMDFAFPTTFFPGVTSLAAAAVLSMEPGEERARVDFHLRPAPTLDISGTVLGLERLAVGGAGANGPAPVVLRLVPEDAPETPAAFEVRRATSGRGGEFTFARVPSGRYRIRVLTYPGGTATNTAKQASAGLIVIPGNGALAPVPMGTTIWADVPVTLGDKSATGVAVPLQTGASVRGSIVFAGAAPQPSADQLQRTVMLIQRAEGGELGSYPASRIEADRTFRTVGFPPGRYSVGIMMVLEARIWQLASVTIGGREVGGTGFELGSRGVTDAVMTLTDRPTMVSGSVRDAAGAPADATVIAWLVDPVLRRVSTPYLPPAIQAVRPNGRGVYKIGIRAGEYFVATMASPVPVGWRDAAFLEKLAASAARVRIDAGQSVVRDLVAR